MSKFIFGALGIILMVEDNEYINIWVDLGKVIDNGSSSFFFEYNKIKDLWYGFVAF